MADAAAVIAGILNGDFDESLADIAEAGEKRLADGAVERSWKLDFEGIDISKENCTGKEAILIERMTGQPFRGLHVSRSSPAGVVVAIITSVLIERQGMNPLDVDGEMSKHSALKLLDSVTEYTVPNPPKDGGTSETSPS